MDNNQENLENLNKEVEKSGLKSKKIKRRTAKVLLSFFALTSLCSCSGQTMFHGFQEFKWIQAMLNLNAGDGEDDSDIAHGIGARFSYKQNSDSYSFSDVFEDKVKTMDANSYIGDYFELVEIVDEKTQYPSITEVLYSELGLTDEDIMYYKTSSNSYGVFQIAESGGEKLKNNPDVINLWYYYSTDEYQPSYYLPYILRAKTAWKENIRPELHSWFENKVREEQEAILKTNNTNWALKNDYVYELNRDDVQNIDLATSKGLIPYKLGTNFLQTRKYSFNASLENGISLANGCGYWGSSTNLKYIYYGSKDGYGNSSLAYNNLILEAKYHDFDVSNLLGDSMQYDDYRDIMLTTKESIAINSVSYDIEVYNVVGEEVVKETANNEPSDFWFEVGDFRLEQLGTYREYAKRIDGSLVGPWLATQNAIKVGTNSFEKNYVFKEEGQTKYWGYLDSEEKEKYYFKEGQTYHIELSGVPTSLIGSEKEWTEERVNEFRLVVPKACNLRIGVGLNGKNKYSFYKIKNLKIDYDVVDSWTYIAKYTEAGFSSNINNIYTHY